jgi:hypothetical protein
MPRRTDRGTWLVSWDFYRSSHRFAHRAYIRRVYDWAITAKMLVLTKGEGGETTQHFDFILCRRRLRFIMGDFDFDCLRFLWTPVTKKTRQFLLNHINFNQKRNRRYVTLWLFHRSGHFYVQAEKKIWELNNKKKMTLWKFSQRIRPLALFFLISECA